MTTLLDKFNESQIKKDLPEFRAGDTLRVHQQIKEAGKERIQVFEGIVISRRGKLGPNATFTVRKISGDIGVEKIFPLNLPTIKKIEVTRRGKVRRAKLYYLRKRLGRKRKVKERIEEQVKKVKKEEPAQSEALGRARQTAELSAGKEEGEKKK